MAVKKRAVIINGRKTSITLEDQYWSELAAIAVRKNTSRPKIITHVAETRDHLDNLSRALRLYVLEEMRNMYPEKRDVA
jgi:predicted DNA-binding ribbon-helix-helix protein